MIEAVCFRIYFDSQQEIEDAETEFANKLRIQQS